MSIKRLDRTQTILSYVRCPLFIEQSIEELIGSYSSAEPYPHLVLDNLFADETLGSLLAELPPRNSPKWVNERHDHMVKSNLRSAVDLEEHAFQFTSNLHSAGFLYFLSEITGIKALLPDPYLTGAGYHLIPEGGNFDVHADRNTDHNTGMLRRLVMLIYLNKSWKSEYGGQLELWSKDGMRCEKVIEPIFNRTIIFEIDDNNFHAVRPVVTGQGVVRRSFATYFHTIREGVVAHNSIFLPPIYQSKTEVYRKIAKDTLPPFVFRALKGLRRWQEARSLLKHR